MTTVQSASGPAAQVISQATINALEREVKKLEELTSRIEDIVEKNFLPANEIAYRPINAGVIPNNNQDEGIPRALFDLITMVTIFAAMVFALILTHRDKVSQ